MVGVNVIKRGNNITLGAFIEGLTTRNTATLSQYLESPLIVLTSTVAKLSGSFY